MTEAQKSIQKYPELMDCKNQKDYVDRVFALHPELPKEASNQLQQERNQAIIALMLASPFQTEEQKEDLRNQTWESNHLHITETIHRIISEKGRMPTTNILSKETGFSRLTVRKHLKEFHHSPFYQEQLQQFRALSTKVVIQLFDLAMTGDVKAAKAYLDAVGGLPGLEPEATSPKPATNYIQINNNIKIDQLTFGLLPETVQQQITRLVLEGLQTTSGLPAHPENQ